MTVVAGAIYREGARIRDALVDIDEPFELRPEEFAWIGLEEPTAAELLILQTRFKLHPLAVEDALRAHQLPKVDLYGRQLFIVTRTARLEAHGIVYGETHLFMGPGYVITVRHGSPHGHQTLRAELEAAPGRLSRGVDHIVHAVLDFVVEGYLPVVAAIEEEVLSLERRALDAFLDREEVNRIFALRRELMRFQRILEPMGQVAQRLEALEAPYADPEIRPYFGDVHDTVRHVTALIQGLADVLTSVFEVSTLLEQQRQGASMRKLAAWAAILAVPTAIAGIYGMNFSDLPALHWPHGALIVLGAIAVVCVALYARLKQTRWL